MDEGNSIHLSVTINTSSTFIIVLLQSILILSQYNRCYHYYTINTIILVILIVCGTTRMAETESHLPGYVTISRHATGESVKREFCFVEHSDGEETKANQYDVVSVRGAHGANLDVCRTKYP